MVQQSESNGRDCGAAEKTACKQRVKEREDTRRKEKGLILGIGGTNGVPGDECKVARSVSKQKTRNASRRAASLSWKDVNGNSVDSGISHVWERKAGDQSTPNTRTRNVDRWIILWIAWSPKGSAAKDCKDRQNSQVQTPTCGTCSRAQVFRIWDERSL